MKQPYEKPVIFKLQSGLMNKFGPSYLKRVRDKIDGVSVSRLVEGFGSPLFVFSERKIRRQYRYIYELFSSRYPNVHFGWSYKTNYLDAICSILHQEGAWAEVVSSFEYEKARRQGIEGSRIIFNGPYKEREALKRAVEEGAIINIDHFEEIQDLEEVASSLEREIKVGIRINMDTGISPQWTRFGFNLESGQALDAVKRMVYGKRLILNGLHCHIGTFILDPSAYAVQIKKMLEFAYMLEDDFGLHIEYLDIGGGFPSRNRLKGIYLPPEVSVPSLEEFAEAICDTLLRNLRPNDFPNLFLESGRAIVDEAGYLITTVHAIKRLPDSMRAYVVDAGVNLLFTSFWYNFNIEVERAVEGSPEPAIIFGPLCMNIDVVAEHAYLPPLPRGTRLIISPVGAYNVTQWMQFISYRPNVVLITQRDTLELIRKGESLEDIVQKEYVPEELKISK
jgi:diaminopimelate decarboxylase